MNKLRRNLLILCYLSIGVLYGQDPAAFITTWKTDNPGSSCSTCITLPTVGSGYSYDVDWDNDGTYEDTGVTGSITHDYGTAGTYQVAIRGNFPRIYFNNTGDKEKILSIDQWGDIVWSSMSYAFYGCSNLGYTATDSPDLSSVTNTTGMFRRATSFNGDLSSWDVSNVTIMLGMFRSASSFNGDLSTWDVSNVTNMYLMFSFATSFNQDLSTWDVSNVTNMYGMFFYATSFNQDLSTWDVSNVTNMYVMFNGASSFNGDLSTWDVSNVTNMYGMFWLASSFNGDLSTWDVSNVTNMYGMFLLASSFNGDLSTWDVSNVTNMQGMFEGASSFNGDLSTWDVGNVTSMGGMFADAVSFNGDLSTWDVSNVTKMYGMFSGASSFNGDLSTWDVRNVTNMYGMFSGASSFNGDIGTWDVSNVTSMGSMFSGATSFNGDLSTWDVSSVTRMSYMFFRATSFNGDLSAWDVSNVTNMYSMFNDATSFNGDLSTWDVSNVTAMAGMFRLASSFNGDIGTWDVSNVSSMGGMFWEATSFNQDLSTWDVSNVNYMESMLSYSGMDVTNYDNTLIGWAAQNVQQGLTLGANGLEYCASAAARDDLLNNHGWTIVGDSENCPCEFAFTTTVQHTTCGLDNGQVDISISEEGTAPYTYTLDGDPVTFPVTGLAPGEYTIVGTDADQCSFSQEITIEDSQDIDVSFTATDRSCGLANGTIDASIAFANGDVSYTMDGTSTTMPVTGLDVGSYTLVATDASGCSYTEDVTIEGSDALSISYTPSPTSCGGDNGALDYDLATGTSPITFTIDNTNIALPLVQMAAGDYTITATDANGCENTQTITIEDSEELTATFSVSETSCGLANASIDVNIASGTGPFSYTVNGTSATLPLTDLVAGTYDVICTDANQCQLTETIVIEGSQDIDMSFTATDRSCGLANGAIDASIAFANGDVSYTMDGTSTTMPVTGLEVGSYTLVATDASGCGYTEDVTIGGTDALEIAYTSTASSCGQNAGMIDYELVSGQGPISFELNNTTVTLPLQGLQAGDYTITATDASGCSYTETVTIALTQSLYVNYEVVDRRCGEDGKVNALSYNASGEVSYTIDGIEVMMPYNGLAVGTHTIVATDENGCQFTKDINIEGSDALIISYETSEVSCGLEYGSIDYTILSGVSPITFMINDSEADLPISGLNAGIYTIVATDANGCEFKETVEVETMPALLFEPIVQQSMCGQETASIDIDFVSGASPVVYYLNGDIVDFPVTNPDPGTYEIYGIDANGCSYSQEVTLEESQQLVVDFIASETTCGLVNGQIDVVEESYSGSISYTLNGQAVDMPVTGLDVGPYEVTATDAAGCTYSEIVSIYEGNELNVVTEITSSMNNMNDGSIVCKILSVEYPITFMLDGDPVASTITDLAPGEYYFTAEDANGCLYEEWIVIYSVEMMSLNSTTYDTSLEDILIYPNPVSERLFVKLNNDSLENISYAIYTSTGKSIIEERQLSTSIDISTLSDGVYFVVLHSDTGKSIRRIVVMK